MPSYQYRDPHNHNKTVSRPLYLNHWNLYTLKNGISIKRRFWPYQRKKTYCHYCRGRNRTLIMICWYQHIELLISTNGCCYQQLMFDIKESIELLLSINQHKSLISETELLISTNHLSISTIQTDLLTWTNNLLIPTIHFLISTNRWNSWYQQIAKGEMGLNCG